MNKEIDNLIELIAWAKEQHSGGVEYIWEVRRVLDGFHGGQIEFRRVTFEPTFPDTQGGSESFYLSKQFSATAPQGIVGNKPASKIISYFDATTGERLSSEHLDRRKRMERNFIQKRIEKFKRDFGEDF